MKSSLAIEVLSALPGLTDVPRDEFQWLLEHGEVRRVDDGTTFRGVGDDLQGLMVVISGRFSIRIPEGSEGREIRAMTPGRITGRLPYSRMTVPRAYVVADGPVEFLVIRHEDFREMARACYEFTAKCVQEMLSRVRDFKADDKRLEKMAALGRLSAGLAHELNNPTSAATRAAQYLDGARSELIAASRALGSTDAEGSSEALRALETAGRTAADAPRSSLERADLEDRLGAWLDEQGVDARLARSLMDRGLTTADLSAAVPSFGAGQLALVLRYLAADHAVRALVADLSSATDRIHTLVAAVKRHTSMDRDPTVETIHLAPHLEDTVTLMSAKAAQKGASIALQIEPDLPTVAASVADLNQVWMHLIDNAVDAVGAGGEIVIEASRTDDGVSVCIVDDGPGISEELRERVFEPFFTTKEVGEGRGLGLDLVRTVVRACRGTVVLASIPGRTEFRVALPASGAEGAIARSGR